MQKIQKGLGERNIVLFYFQQVAQIQFNPQ